MPKTSSVTASNLHSLGARSPSTSQNSLSNGSSSLKDPPSRHSPVAPLAPLEYLQKQRRGSITDPSLHAAVPKPLNSNQSSSSRPTETSPLSSTAPLDFGKNGTTNSRPSSTYVFGDATRHSTETHSSQIQKLLRSPSSDHYPPSPSSLSRHDAQGAHEASTRNSTASSASDRSREDIRTNIDPREILLKSPARHSPRDIPFDLNMRRHSIAVGHGHDLRGSSHLNSLSQGTKRKMSTPVNEEIDPQLVGPGVSNAEGDGPASKRRGSVIEHRGLGQLSLYDRRNSVDSRGTLWLNDRRDPSSSLLSSVYPSAFRGESPHGRQLATYSWPPTSPDHAGAASAQNETGSNMSAPRAFDPHSPLLGMANPVTFASDRRMSVSESVSSNTASGLGPARVLRSRSRPPSRQLRASDPGNEKTGAPSTSPAAPDESANDAPSPTGSAKVKESGSTPYSRSPELRVSHKLAERKRRKEMKELFDELRDQLPADRGMKASKWEILSKAIDFVNQLKQTHQEMAREIDMLRHELDVRQGGIPPFPPGGPPHAVVFGQPALSGPYPPQGVQLHPILPHSQTTSRPGSSGDSPGGGPGVTPSALNGKSEAPPT